ncbi:hypothetical protein CJ030_MR5G010042 [Morella rubra]|uniref:Uncharacterized protein n=1 Tax=Morella rubra TaxID=262757 RepID=A0A6A1VG32_9ROSI|nr:hypothetical protein CJ030_MR5G010042 [Morella rubra]
MLLISLITEKFDELEVRHEESWRHWVQYPINIVPKWGGTDTPDSHCKLIVIAIMRIPTKFVRKYGEGLSNMTFLNLPTATKWRVKLMKRDGEVGNRSSRKSIIKAKEHIERPAWADAMVVELRESIWTMVETTHMLCMGFHTRLTTLENNFSLTKEGLREEMIVMRQKLICVQPCPSCTNLSVPFHIRSHKQVDIMEEQLVHVHDHWTRSRGAISSS